MYISTSSGFAMGLWTIFSILLFKTKWRIACFALSDRLCDWVYVHVALGLSSLTRKMATSWLVSVSFLLFLLWCGIILAENVYTFNKCIATIIKNVNDQLKLILYHHWHAQV
jgi:hypothetical protein